MQHFYLQRSLTQGSLGLSAEQQLNLRQNADAAKAPAVYFTLPINGTTGQQQAESTAIVGTVVGNGLLAVVFTSVLTSKVFLVPVTNGDTNVQVAVKIEEFVALEADEDFSLVSSVASDTNVITWVFTDAAENDPSMNINVGGPGTTVTGITSDPVSDNAQAGVAPIVGTPGEVGQLYETGNRTFIRVAGGPNVWEEIFRTDPNNGFGLVASTTYSNRGFALRNEEQDADLQELNLAGDATNEIITIQATS